MKISATDVKGVDDASFGSNFLALGCRRASEFGYTQRPPMGVITAAMSEDSSTSGSAPRSWFGRLSQALTGEPKSRDDLLQDLRNAHASGLLAADTLEMIEGAMTVAELQVSDVMVPRGQMVSVPIDTDIAEILAIVVSSGHSRFPVHGEDRDEILGVLLAKDLLRCFASGEPPTLHALLRPAVLVPESKSLNVLLREFRLSRNHMAVVVDEFGGVAGLVTIEDLLEEIVGEIDDEHDDAPDDSAAIALSSDGIYQIDALMPIEDFNNRFQTELPDDDYDTIGGLLTGIAGHLPEVDEHITIGRLRFTVLESDGRRLHRLEMRLQDD
ncbi:MAG: Magnesium and cobalt efflux protein CorC [Alphaproteobacteria bacterium ADurb.BinA280]|nr:MAG: Magnesium and cobalt efflux protein CorC [Alphaproteobacteria bacterium ADurb.BinA280]